MKKLFYYLSTIVAVLLISCSDENSPDIIIPEEIKAVLILNEGDYDDNNSTLSLYDITSGTYTRDIFRPANTRKLGALANDMTLYGSKLYIAVNLSGTIEVVNPSTGKSIKQINLKNDDINKEPRFITSYEGKIYVTSTADNTVTRIDTTTLNVEASVTVGMDPEEIVASNGKLYVANSGGWSGFNNTISIIDISSFEVIKEVEVGLNPVNLDTDRKGNVYISTLGNYYDVPGVFQKYNPITETVTTIEEITNSGKFLIHDNKAYIIQGSYGNPYSVLVYDCEKEEVITNNFITDDTQIEIIYSISVDDKTGDIFIMESDYIVDGSVYCFDKEGKLKYSIEAIGKNPNSVVVL